MTPSIKDAVAKYLRAKQDEESLKHPYNGLISASQLGQCLRRIFYAVNKVEASEPQEDWDLMTMETGNLFHRLIQSAYKAENPDAELEQTYKDDVVSVRADIVTDDEVVEIKSVHSGKFDHFKRELQTKTILEINPEHVLQAVLGAIKFGKDKARLVYVSRDNGFIQEFCINVDEKLIGMLYNELEDIRSMLACGSIPPPKPRLYGEKVNKEGLPKECQYCNWKTRCLNEREG